MLFRLEDIFPQTTSIHLRKMIITFMYKRCAKGFCMPSVNNDSRSCFMDHMANYGAMTTSHKRCHVDIIVNVALEAHSIFASI